MQVQSAPRIHLDSQIVAGGGAAVIDALVSKGVDAKAFKGLEAQADTFAKLGGSPEGIGDESQIAGLAKLVTPDVFSALLGKDGYVSTGDLTFMISNRAFIGGAFLERVRRDTGIKYNTMVGGGAPVPGCTWATVSNPSPQST